MESEFVAQLIDLGITGLFLGFLIFSHREQSRRLDAYVDRLLKTLSNIEKEREEGFDKIRDRYDEVISKYDNERDRLLIEISGKLDEGLREMNKRHEEERIARLTRNKKNGS